jgi:hypothetical protein
VLILSDLGCLDENPFARNAWRRFGQRLRFAGVTAVALMPCPRRYWHRQVVRHFIPLCWNRGERFPSDLHNRTQAIPASGSERSKQPDAGAKLRLPPGLHDLGVFIRRRVDA